MYMYMYINIYTVQVYMGEQTQQELQKTCSEIVLIASLVGDG